MTLLDPRSLLASLPYPCCTLDATGAVLQINPVLDHLLGHPEALVCSQLFADLLHPDDHHVVGQTLVELTQQALHPGFTCRHRDHTGRYCNIQWQPTLLAGAQWLLVGCDLSRNNPQVAELHRRLLRSEQALQQSERRLNEIQRLTQTGNWEFDLSHERLWWSDEIYRIFELDPAQHQPSLALSRSLIHPDDYPTVMAAFSATLQQQQPFEVNYRILLYDGRVKYLHERAYLRHNAYGTPVTLVSTVQDVTTWREAELDLRRKDAAVAASLNGIAIADMDGTLIYVNQSFLDLWGYANADHLLGKSVMSFWGVQQIADQVQTGLSQHGAWRGEMPARHQDGSLRTMLVNASLMHDRAGLPLGMLASFRDITERKHHEDAMRLKDQAIATSLNAMVITDPAYHVIYANPAFLQLWGYVHADDVTGRPLSDFCDPAMILQALAQIHEQGAWQGELIAQRSNQAQFEVLLAASPVRADDGSITQIVASMLDLSESRRLQKQFFEVQKLESVGRLAGGIAHDFNNLLTVMRGYLDLALLSLSPDEALHQDLLQVSHAVDSASGLTQQLLTFARQQAITPQPLDLNQAIRRIEGMLRRLLDLPISLQLNLAADLPAIRFDPAQIEQILINLALNARDAMPEGGRLTLSTELAWCHGQDPHQPGPSLPKPYVQLTLADTGEGMPPEVCAQIFEPFFTTKPVGKGAGLGLAMVYGAITQHGGTIKVNSTPGHGTVFYLGLPLA
ncbi:MAG: PAS domain-containing protein [Oscillochloridaceae bacterium umkhey_bin13]